MEKDKSEKKVKYLVRFLKDNKVYNAYIKSLIRRGRNKNWILKYACDGHNFGEVLMSSFRWRDSYGGQSFWSNLNSRFYDEWMEKEHNKKLVEYVKD